MLQLLVKPKIFKFDTFSEFCDSFNIGSNDLILTHEFLYADYMKNHDLQCDYLFQERYGVGEPNDEMIDRMLSDMKQKDYRRIIVVGGGTVIDIAKIFALEKVEKSSMLFDKSAPIRKCRELVIVPTTCGTGSEVTNLSIAEIKSKKTKMGIADEALFADYAVLIPELIARLPFKFFVYSSIDALIHAVESFLAPKSNAFTELFAVKAIEMIIDGYQLIQKEGPDARSQKLEQFLVASNFAGIAFGNTGVGAVHALSYPLGGNYHVPHGESNYTFFIAVMKKYASIDPDGKIAVLAGHLSRILGTDADPFQALSQLLETVIERKPLHEYGMKPEEIALFSKSVIDTQQRLLVNSYVPMDYKTIYGIFESLY